MKNAKFRLVNFTSSRNILTVDGKQVYPKKGKNGAYDVHLSTEKETIHVSVKTFLFLDGALWWLASIVRFFISVFGIFDTYENHKCRAICYEADVSVQDGGNYRLRFLNWKEGEKAIALEGVETVEQKNECYTDKRALKRKKIMIGVKIALGVVCAFAVGFLIF